VKLIDKTYAAYLSLLRYAARLENMLGVIQRSVLTLFLSTHYFLKYKFALRCLTQEIIENNIPQAI
jgi:hypothetical protein